MSKLIMWGSLTGTGSITLRPPEMASDIELELPTNGTHLAAANASGMPLLADGTPIIESGSNSDGDWVRWADGRQEAEQAGLTQGAWTYPLPFIDIPKCVASVEVTNLPRFCVVSPSRTESACGLWAFTDTGISSAVTMVAKATGHWK